MKVLIKQVVEVDPEKWAREYGLDRKDVREDVKGYFSDAQERVDALGLGLKKLERSK